MGTLLFLGGMGTGVIFTIILACLIAAGKDDRK